MRRLGAQIGKKGDLDTGEHGERGLGGQNRHADRAVVVVVRNGLVRGSGLVIRMAVAAAVVVLETFAVSLHMPRAVMGVLLARVGGQTVQSETGAAERGGHGQKQAPDGEVAERHEQVQATAQVYAMNA